VANIWHVITFSHLVSEYSKAQVLWREHCFIVFQDGGFVKLLGSVLPNNYKGDVKMKKNNKNEVASTKRTQKPVTLYLDGIYLAEIEKIQAKRAKSGQASGYSAILREMVILGIQKGLLS